MIHTDGKRTIANDPRSRGVATVTRLESGKLTNGSFTLPATPNRATGLPRLPVGGFVTPTAEADWRRLNSDVHEATRLG